MEWCVANCGNTPPNSPATLCTCPTELKLGVTLASNSSGAPVVRLDFDRLTKGMDNSVAAKVLEKMEQTRRLKELRAKVKQLEESKSTHAEAAAAPKAVAPKAVAASKKGMQQQAALVPGSPDALLVPKPRPKEHNETTSKKAAASTKVASARVKVARAKAAKKIVDAAKVVDAAKARVASATAKRVVLASAQGGAAANQNRSAAANMSSVTALSADEEKRALGGEILQMQTKQAQLEISRVRDAEQSLQKRESVMAQREQAWVAVKARAKGSSDPGDGSLKFEDAEATALQMARVKAEGEADIIRSRAKNEAEAELKQAHLKA